jgi:hypothetical protein
MVEFSVEVQSSRALDFSDARGLLLLAFSWYSSWNCSSLFPFSVEVSVEDCSNTMSTSSTTDSATSSSLPIPLTHIHHLITLKLTRENYLLWKAQIIPYLKGQHLYGFLDGSRPAPSQATASAATPALPSSDLQAWHIQDQMILSALISSLSETILAHVVNCRTSREVWLCLEKMFTSQSRARQMQLHHQISTLKKGDSSIADYFHTFTTLADTLAAIESPLSDYQLVSFFMNGLGSEYDAMVTSIQTHSRPYNLDDLYGLFLSHELRLAQNQPIVDLSHASAHYVTHSSSHRGGNNSGRGGARNNFGPTRGSFSNSPRTHRGRGRGRNNSNRPVCQVCHKLGHAALTCYHRFDNSYSADSPQQMHALYASPQAASDLNWYSDSGATHHLTNDLANLNVRAEEYTGSEGIRVGNGKSLPVKHIGTTQFSTPTSTFLLNDVLHVPQISKNLISVHKFTNDTNTLMEFHPSFFNVKDLDSRKLLVQGASKDGLYPFPVSSNTNPPRFALLGERASLQQWHSRLGHPAFRLVSHIISKFGLPVFKNKSELFCSACLSSKSKQLPFSLSSSEIKSPLDLIYSDVWGPSPVLSRTGFRYYISFLDAYSRYTWLFPMRHKNDALPIFIKFQKYTERFFNCKIKSIQSDWGGEYRSLNKYFENCGIIHRVSCPHTHQQNGAIERKHRHLVETGLALLSHASVPLRFWEDAFQTACYLINRLPTPLINNMSPFEKLFHTNPDYSFLKTFGCACWPNLRPYNSNKLQPRSTSCVFLGYSPLHKGYKCFHISSGRMYISRDVVFLESQCPFQNSPISPSDSPSILGSPLGLQPLITRPVLRSAPEAQFTAPHHIRKNVELGPK